MDARILRFIWLSTVLCAGSKSVKPLFDYFGSIEKIYDATAEEYKACGIPTSEISYLKNKDLTRSESLYSYCLHERIGFLCFDDPYYPERLKIIDNPPPMFYYRGRLKLLDDYPCFSMVGTRKCTERGYRLAYKIAYDAAARGAVIINGLALGIDAACIAAALDANAYAVGVLGCGIDRIYPPANKELFCRLSASGLIITEFPPFTEPRGSNFPVRNRVISGLCLASCVFEADAEKSGAMITARHAEQQGRRIFAVPGKPDDRLYSGALELIKNGAAVLTEAEDILSEYSMMFPHRINLRHEPTIPEKNLEKYVSDYFGKDNAEKDGSSKESPRREHTRESKPSMQKREKSGTYEKSAASDKQSTENPCVSESAACDTKQNATDVSERDLSLLSATEKRIFELFEQKNILMPDEIAQAGVGIEDVLSSVTLLEVYGFIEALPGGRYKLI